MPMEADIFHIKGPMGAGLQIEDDGVHVCFVAGTGMLTIMDLVAHMILINCGIIPQEESGLKKGFTLLVFGSFYSRQAKFGWNTCEKFHDVCQKLGFTNFRFECRFTVDQKN